MTRDDRAGPSPSTHPRSGNRDTFVITWNGADHRWPVRPIPGGWGWRSVSRWATSQEAWAATSLDAGASRRLGSGARVGSGFVFTSPNGELLRRTNFRRRTFLPAVRRSVGQPMRFHDLRRTHVAMLIAHGQHPKVIRTRLGHFSIQVTLDLYGHLFEGLDEAAAAARLDATFGASRADQTRIKRDQGVIALPSQRRATPAEQGFL